MRYLGSKVKLLSSIEKVIKENNVEGETFADLFAGTGCVGDFFKDKYQVISNDFLFYSYVINRAFRSLMVSGRGTSLMFLSGLILKNTIRMIPISFI